MKIKVGELAPNQIDKTSEEGCGEYINSSKEGLEIVTDFEKCLKIVFDEQHKLYFTVQPLIAKYAESLKSISLSMDFQNTRFESQIRQDTKKYGIDLDFDTDYKNNTMVLFEK